MHRVAPFLFGLLVAGAADARAQTLFAARGLGLPVEAVDARARLLGGSGVGLLGPNTSLANPADAVGSLGRGVTASLQPISTNVQLGNAEDGYGGARFPMIRIQFPFSERILIAVGYGSALEQSWSVAVDGEADLGGEPVPVRDEIVFDGGVSQASLGIGFAISPTLAVGAAVGFSTGGVTRTITRTFTDSENLLLPFSVRARWGYGSRFARFGVRWEPVPLLRVSGTVHVGEDLEITEREGEVDDATAPMPVRMTAGASGWLSSTVLIALSVERTTANDADAVFSPDGSPSAARDTWRFGSGFEYVGAVSTTRVFPFRLGWNYAQLPYHGPDESAASEWAVGLGTGMRVRDESGQTTAAFDFALERGGRSGFESEAIPGGLEESYWRLTFSLSLFGR